MDVRDHCQMITQLGRTNCPMSLAGTGANFGEPETQERGLWLLNCFGLSHAKSWAWRPNFPSVSTLRSLFPVHDYAEVAGAADGRVGVVGEIDARGQIVIRGQ